MQQCVGVATEIVSEAVSDEGNSKRHTMVLYTSLSYTDPDAEWDLGSSQVQPKSNARVPSG